MMRPQQVVMPQHRSPYSIYNNGVTRGMMQTPPSPYGMQRPPMMNIYNTTQTRGMMYNFQPNQSPRGMMGFVPPQQVMRSPPLYNNNTTKFM